MAGSGGQGDPLGPDISNPWEGLADPFNQITQDEIARQQEAAAKANTDLARGITPGLRNQGGTFQQTTGPGVVPGETPPVRQATAQSPYLSHGPTEPVRGWTAQQGGSPAPVSYRPTGRVPNYSEEGPRRFDQSEAPVAGIPQNRDNQAPLGGAALDSYSNALDEEWRPRTDVSDPGGPPG